LVVICFEHAVMFDLCLYAEAIVLRLFLIQNFQDLLLKRIRSFNMP
jgi:hypothetical protein